MHSDALNEMVLLFAVRLRCTVVVDSPNKEDLMVCADDRSTGHHYLVVEMTQNTVVGLSQRLVLESGCDHKERLYAAKRDVAAVVFDPYCLGSSDLRAWAVHLLNPRSFFNQYRSHDEQRCKLFYYSSVSATIQPLQRPRMVGEVGFDDG